MMEPAQDRLRTIAQNQRVGMSVTMFKLLNEAADRLDMLEAEVLNLRAEVARMTAQQQLP